MSTYHIKTFGCQMNHSDSERLRTFLEKKGLKLNTNIDDSDLAIFNTCGVRKSAEDRVFGQIHNVRKKNPKVKIVLTGCIAHRQDVQRKMKNKVDFFCKISDFTKNNFKFKALGLKIGSRIVKNSNLCSASTTADRRQEFLTSEMTEKNNLKLNSRIRLQSEMTEKIKLELSSKTELQTEITKKIQNEQNYLSIQPKYRDKQTASVPIMTGCNNFCSYCVVPYARGREWSRPVEEILAEIKKISEKNYKEILLLGQNVNSYAGKLKFQKPNFKKNLENRASTKIKFPALLELLAKKFPKISFKFLTSHPKDFSVELIEIIKKYKNIPIEIHLPIQSGSSKVLKDMNRPYTKQQYLKLIKQIRQHIPKARITTDIIIGFPTETEAEFQETVQVFQEVNFADAFLNKYSPRPGTAAEKLGDPIPWDTKKKREKILREILKK